jgi:hypothetical protein
MSGHVTKASAAGAANGAQASSENAARTTPSPAESTASH